MVTHPRGGGAIMNPRYPFPRNVFLHLGLEMAKPMGPHSGCDAHSVASYTPALPKCSKR